MPSSSTSTQRIDRLSSSSSSTFRRDDFRRHSTTTSSAKFSTISIGESVKLEEENGETPEKLVQEEDTVVKTEETRDLLPN
ncbi:hypothetical protein B9Z55_027810 [Caenorhabditis nigoni]|uniref:Uncharacterized protein n=1 Tax=Caenorhabditis nigoni TaxID=1611254 RepID=A0A2G5SEE8_9PELO|nr:hypothetical protein B9Z55_027810 [Caenorhabditis nigoni]